MEQENTIDLRRLLALCKKHFRLFIVWTIGLGAIAGGLAAFVIPAQYTATTQILVNQKNNNNNGQAYANQQADVNMINTYKDIITNQVILSEASKELSNPVKVIKEAQPAKYETLADGTKQLVRAAKPAVRSHGKAYDLSAGELKERLSVETQTNSQVFALQAKANDPEEAKQIANTVALTFKKKIKSVMSVNNVTIVSKATKPSTSSFPKPRNFALMGALCGLLLSIVWVVLRDLMDTTVRDDDFMTDELGLTNLGQVGKIRIDKNFQLRQANTNAGTRRV
ncbi:MAG: Wzz/FepE/Etk N-terminal domain-containing protein [Limosilactobacillus ingluviei]|nr:Wzz/FepE/Etk N-terminal domain-containing protein [Limosilactobacillus ingluviei]